MNGIIKRYDAVRGFGFIEPLIGHPDTTDLVFFHCSAVAGYTPEKKSAVPCGTEVKFILVRGERGPQAANIELVPLSSRSLTNPPPVMRERGR